MTYLKFNSFGNIIKVVTVVVISLSLRSSHGSEFQYFGTTIDYWNANSPRPKSVQSLPIVEKSPKENSSAVPITEKESRFPWNTYLDPKNKEFFKEGEYTPPEPFMEIVRNPSDTNLKMWFAYIDKKNSLSDRLQTRMREYMEKNAFGISNDGKERWLEKTKTLTRTEPNVKRYRFRMYYDSHCPHCKKMFGTLKALQGKGFFVEARQIDNDPLGLQDIPVPTEHAMAHELKEKDIKSVPLLLVGDLEKKVIYRITGYQSVQNIFQTLEQEGKN